MFGELRTAHCIVLLVVLAVCACVLTIFPLVSTDTSHAQGHELHKQMVQATLNWRTARLHGFGSRIPVVTVDTRSDDAFMPMQGAQGVTMCNVGVHGDWNSMLSKNEMLLDWLDDQMPAHADELVIVVDASDMLYGGCEVDKLLSNYKRTFAGTGGASVIVGAQSSLFPNGEKYATQRYAELRSRRQKVLNVSGLIETDIPTQVGTAVNGQPCPPRNATLGNNSNSSCNDYEFMDYAFLMGPVSGLHTLLSHVVRTVPVGFLDSMRGFLAQSPQVEESSDQGVAAMYMFDHPDEIALDYSMGLAVSLNDMPNDMLEVRKGHVWNSVTKSEQCFLHFGGSARGYFGYVRGLLADSLKIKSRMKEDEEED